MSSIPIDAPTPAVSNVRREETLRAIRNAVKLGGSMAATLAVAFAVRFWLPRYFGPAAFGQLHFAEAFATAFFVFTSFGVETYIGKEVATRPAHANDFFGGLLVFRFLGSIVLCGAMALVLKWMGKGPVEFELVMLFALGQVAFVLNGSLSAINNANGRVGAQAVINVLSKLLWGGGIIASVLLGGGLRAVAATFFITEWLRSITLFNVVRRQINLRLHFDLRATWAVLAGCLPFFLNVIAQRVYDKVDVNMIAALVNDVEVGWYGAAANVAGISLLFVPIVNSVVFPMSARILRDESVEAMNEVMRSLLRLTLAGCMLICMMLILYGQEIVGFLFKSDFGPAGHILQMLAPTFPLTYVCVFLSMHLIQLGRGWQTTVTSVIAVLINPILNYTFIHIGMQSGNGGGGMGAAAATVSSELLNAIMLGFVLGKAAIDRQFWILIGKLAIICTGVVILHQVIAAPGWIKMFIEAVFYLVISSGWGVLPLHQVLARARMFKMRRAA